MSQIVILDGYVANPGDLDWDELRALGELNVYERTSSDLVVQRSQDADIILTNKCPINKETMNALPNLKYIGLLATGYNNIDIKAAKEQNIPVCNAVGYSAASVAQHVFALMLELTNNVGQHNVSVHNNGWATARDWSFWNKPLVELAGKTMGIYGIGSIGTQVAKVATAFGMTVIATRRNKEKAMPEAVTLVTEDELLQSSDVLTLHAPLSESNQGFINRESLNKMKPSAYLINTGRGGLVIEEDLKQALLSGIIAGAALDVLTEEPPALNHLLLNTPNCLLTPHHAWATRESRKRLIAIATANVRAFMDGNIQNCVNGLS